MNQEEALTHILGIVERSPELTQCRTLKEQKRHQTALKVLRKLIAQRAAKRAWREAPNRQIPDHAKHHDHPLNRMRGL